MKFILLRHIEKKKFSNFSYISMCRWSSWKRLHLLKVALTRWFVFSTTINFFFLNSFFNCTRASSILYPSFCNIFAFLLDKNCWNDYEFRNNNCNLCWVPKSSPPTPPIQTFFIQNTIFHVPTPTVARVYVI